MELTKPEKRFPSRQEPNPIPTQGLRRQEGPLKMLVQQGAKIRYLKTSEIDR